MNQSPYGTQQDPNSLGKKVGSAAGRFVKKRTASVAARLVKNVFQKVIGKGIKLLILKTAPIWGSILFILGIAWLAFMLIYAFPRTILEDKLAAASDKIEAFFGFSKEDMKGYEDILDTYKEVASRWDEGLNEFQKQQVQSYEFSWAILAGVDRMRNDPLYYKEDYNGILFPGGGDYIAPPTNYISIYKAAANKFGVDWNVLASIHFHESTYSTFPSGSVSVAGAVGPMQFMPATWEKYKVDGDGDGKMDIMNTADAIYSAANYLRASGYQKNQRKALYAYNHADWYVNMILSTAQQIKNKDLEVENPVDESEGLEEKTTDDQSNESSFFRSKKLLTPKPEETFEALRPIFHWKDSKITTVCKKEVTSTNEQGETVTETVTETTEETVKLLTTADTYEGTYTHTYKWVTESAGNCTITKEVLNTIIPPDNFMQPFYDYLESVDIKDKLDIETTLELIALFDERYRLNLEDRESLNTDNYPKIEGSNGWVWPTVSTRITSGFGDRSCEGCSKFHDAIDIGAIKPGVAGDPIFAVADGTVIVSKYSQTAGNMVTIDHGKGVQSRYIHMSARLAKVGDKVKGGDIIGKMGTTGNSTGVHLDFQITIDGKKVDPRHYFNM